MSPRKVGTDELSADLDLCMTCVGLSLGAAGAVLVGDEAAAMMAALLTQWPETVHQTGLVVGMRTALAMAHVLDLTPEQIGAVAAALLETEQETV